MMSAALLRLASLHPDKLLKSDVCTFLSRRQHCYSKISNSIVLDRRPTLQLVFTCDVAKNGKEIIELRLQLDSGPGMDVIFK